MDELITSATNPVAKRFRALADRKHRRREGAFVVEGLQPVWRAVTAGWPIETLVVAPDLLVNPAAVQMVAEQESRGVRVSRLSAELFTRLSDRDGPAGLAAMVRGTVGGLGSFVPGDGPLIGLYRAGNPGNIGTILRTADAAGAGGMVLVGPSADPLSPAAVKSSMGSVFAVPLAHAASSEEFFDWLVGDERVAVAITGTGRSSLWDNDLDGVLTGRCALLLGSEGDGLPEDVALRCAYSVRIPMWGTAESLNLATAASVVLYEIARRRGVVATDRHQKFERF